MLSESRAALSMSGDMQAADGPDKREAREVAEGEGEGVGGIESVVAAANFCLRHRLAFQVAIADATV